MQSENKKSFKKRLKSMFNVDAKRMFKTPLYYIMVAISLVMPILILVMTSMMDGTTTTDPNGNVTVMEGFKNVWQIIGTTSGDSSSMGMSLTSMCNINILFFLIAVIVCVFVSDDFRSGYAKNLFAVRSKKSDYALSKTIIGFIGGASMIIAFFIGSILGGAMVGLPFDVGSAGVYGITMCVLSKILLVPIFVSIYQFASVIAKQRLWLSILISFAISMLMFTMVPIITPLNSTIINVILCAAGSVMFSALFVYLSTVILNKKDIL